MMGLSEKIMKAIALPLDYPRKQEMTRWADEAAKLESQNATLAEALQEVMVMFPDMCADADMCDDPHTLATINKAREAIAEAKENTMFTPMNLLDKRNTKITTDEGDVIKVNNNPSGWYASTWRDDKPSWDGTILIDSLSISDMCCWLNVRTYKAKEKRL